MPPELRPSKTPLYRLGCSSGSKIFAVGIFRVDIFWVNNDTLNSMDQLERSVVAILQGLHGLAPAAIENRVRGQNACRSGCIFRAHDANQHIDGAPCVATRQRADFSEGFGHGIWRFT